MHAVIAIVSCVATFLDEANFPCSEQRPQEGAKPELIDKGLHEGNATF